MAAIMLIQPDAFGDTFAGVAAATVGDVKEGESPARRSFAHVRRPLRGVQIKNDTYATIQVKTALGSNRALIDAGAVPIDVDGKSTTEAIGRSALYSNFLLQNINETRAEKAQIVETFGEPYVFFYGERPRILDCSGVLLNSEDFNWRAEFWHNYENELRGTSCVRNKARVYLSWDDVVVEGYMMEASASEVAAPDNMVIQFRFSLFVTNYQNVSRIGRTDFPTGTTTNLNPNDADVTTLGVGILKSSTLKVRAFSEQVAASKKNSILQTLRDGIAGAIDIAGQLDDAIHAASTYLFGRVVRVPIGFTGAAAFDEALLSSQLPKTSTKLTVTAHHGKINENLDEYIDSASRLSTFREPLDLFDAQVSTEDQYSYLIEKTMKDAGLDTGPTNEVMQLVAGAAFGVVSVIGGAKLIDSGIASSTPAIVVDAILP